MLRLAPWRRAPLLLLRRPGVAVALLAAALVATLPAAAVPMFLSSAQHATMHRQIDDTCLWQVGMQVEGELVPQGSFLWQNPVVGVPRFHGRAEAIADRPVRGLSEPVVTGRIEVNAELVDRPLPEPDIRGLTLMARPGAAEHVELLAGPVGEGLWLPHEHAERQGIEVGDELRLELRGVIALPWGGEDGVQPDSVPVTLPVAAIYRDLRSVPTTDYWCGVEHIYAGSEGERLDPDAIILPTALVDTDTLLMVGESTRTYGEQIIEMRLEDTRLTIIEAADLGGEIVALQQVLQREHADVFIGGQSSAAFLSYLGQFERRANVVRQGLLPPVLPITAAGVLVGLVVVAAAAVFWVQRRRRELMVLAGHGVSARALGSKAALEALPAVLAGAAAGWGGAWALMGLVGPGSVMAPGVVLAAAAAAAAVGVLGLALIGIVAGMSCRALLDQAPVTHRRGWWARVPWELGLVALAPVAWWSLAADRAVDAGGAGVVMYVPPRLLVAPILVIVGGAVLVSRVAVWWWRRRTPSIGRTGGGAAGGWLAWRRLARHSVVAGVLAVATAVPVATATFGAAATGSIRTTADAQLQLSLGSDTVIEYDRWEGVPETPAVFEGRSTEVLRLRGRLGGLSVDVLAVDPETYTDGAFWDRRMSGPDLADAMAALTVSERPAVVASPQVPRGPEMLRLVGQEVPVAVVSTQLLPGPRGGYPLLLIHRDALAELLPEHIFALFFPQLWVAGPPADTVAAAAASGLSWRWISTTDDQRGSAVHEPVTYTFGYLIALSLFTGLIGVVALLLYLESRTMSHRRAYIMLRRLGLRPAAHLRALWTELAVPVGTGLVVGLACALALAYFLRAGFDMQPRRAPGALLQLPVPLMIATTAAVLLLAVAAAAITHRRVSRTKPSEVLRDTQ